MDTEVREKEDHKIYFHLGSHFYILGPSPVYGSLQYVTQSRGEYYSTPVVIIMGFALAAFAVGLFLTVKTMWNKHHNTASTQEETPY